MLTELIREGKDGFLRQTFKDAKKEAPSSRDEVVFRGITELVRAYIIRPSIEKKQISQSSLGYLGNTFFFVQKGRAGSASTQLLTLIALRDESLEKFYIRMLFEYWDFVLNKRMENAPQWFKILHWLYEHKKGTASQIAEQLNTSWNNVNNAIRYARLNKETMYRQPFIKIVAKVRTRRGVPEHVWALEDWALNAWGTFMDEKTRRQWDSWKKYRPSNLIRWHRIGGRFKKINSI